MQQLLSVGCLPLAVKMEETVVPLPVNLQVGEGDITALWCQIIVHWLVDEIVKIWCCMIGLRCEIWVWRKDYWEDGGSCDENPEMENAGCDPVHFHQLLPGQVQWWEATEFCTSLTVRRDHNWHTQRFDWPYPWCFIVCSIHLPALPIALCLCVPAKHLYPMDLQALHSCHSDHLRLLRPRP